MRDDDNALLFRAPDHRVQEVGVLRHDADRSDPVLNQFLDDPDLLFRKVVTLGRPHHDGVDAKIIPRIANALTQSIEPRNTRDLDHHSDFVRVGLAARVILSIAGRLTIGAAVAAAKKTKSAERERGAREKY